MLLAFVSSRLSVGTLTALRLAYALSLASVERRSLAPWQWEFLDDAQ